MCFVTNYHRFRYLQGISSDSPISICPHAGRCLSSETKPPNPTPKSIGLFARLFRKTIKILVSIKSIKFIYRLDIRQSGWSSNHIVRTNLSTCKIQANLNTGSNIQVGYLNFDLIFVCCVAVFINVLSLSLLLSVHSIGIINEDGVTYPSPYIVIILLIVNWLSV